MLFLKLMFVPVLVALMSLAARRFGPRLGGLLIGLPWVTGPVVFFLGQEKGDIHATGLASGAMLATVSISAYAIAFGWLGRSFRWPLALAGGAIAYGVIGWGLSGLSVTPTQAAVTGAAALLAATVLIPAPRQPAVTRALPWWDIPVRMLVSAVLVCVIALVSDQLGATASGIVATFPVLLTVIGTFTHHQWGSDAHVGLLRGITLSLLSFVLFFWVVGMLALPQGLVVAYALATVAAVCLSASLMAFNHRRAVAARAVEAKGAA
jgi:hypothetical protein